MARSALIYEALVVKTGNKIAISGLAYGVIDNQPVVGERTVTDFVCKSWIDALGIGILDSKGHEFMILSVDEKSETLMNGLPNLFAMAFLSSPKDQA